MQLRGLKGKPKQSSIADGAFQSGFPLPASLDK